MSTSEDSSSESTNSKNQSLRLFMYLKAAHDRMEKNFTKLPCLGLHFGFGEKELTRLQEAIKRHGREDHFDNLSIPVDVLLRTISFIPNHCDPRVILSARRNSESETTTTRNPQELDDEHDLKSKTLLRLCATNSNLLLTVMENKCILGGKDISAASDAPLGCVHGVCAPLADQRKASLAQATFLKEESKRKREMLQREKEAKTRAAAAAAIALPSNNNNNNKNATAADPVEAKLDLARSRLLATDDILDKINKQLSETEKMANEIKGITEACSLSLLDDISHFKKSKNKPVADKTKNLWGQKKEEKKN